MLYTRVEFAATCLTWRAFGGSSFLVVSEGWLFTHPRGNGAVRSAVQDVRALSYSYSSVFVFTGIGNDGAACPTSWIYYRRQAGAVRSRAAQRKATSDWMELEKQRGISITSTVLSFEYSGNHINLLDTPGHQVCISTITRCVYTTLRTFCAKKTSSRSLPSWEFEASPNIIVQA